MSFIDNLKGKNLGFWLVLLTMLWALIGFGIACLITGKTLDGVSIIIGALIGNISLLMNFKWGSSDGSKKKTELLNKQSPPPSGTPL